MNATAQAVPSGAEDFGPNPRTPSIEEGRLFSCKRGSLYSLRADGSVFGKSLTTGWAKVMESPDAAKLDERKAWFARWRAQCPWWAQTITDIPTMDDLEQQLREDGACETPTGHTTEPDGTGPDGVPAWLRVFRLV